MTYVLESASEFERLERQSLHPNYDFRQELTGITFYSDESILDAGCGSGILSRYLTNYYRDSKILGLDSSETRIAEATAKSAHLPNIDFKQGNLLKTPFEDNRFSTIICRFVLQHLPSQLQGLVLAEMLRISKPGGRIIVIDSDGLIANLWPVDVQFEQTLNLVVQKSPVDFFVGRKIPKILEVVGWQQIDWKIQTTECHGNRDCGRQEIGLMQERLNAAIGAITSILGSLSSAEEFISKYVESMSRSNAVYFQNKFIVTAIKPQNTLGLAGEENI